MQESENSVSTNNNNTLNDICAQIIARSNATSTRIEKMEILVEELHKSLDYYFWIGFYYPKDTDMTMGPSAGPPACASIGYDGVCGKSYKENKTIIVPDIEKFPGHIVCDPNSKSEIVLPVRDSENKLFAVLDVDSDSLNAFSENDANLLENLLYELFTAQN